LTGVPTVVWAGDIAFVHDSNALVGIMERDADLRIVVADNRGGGIFSFLPQASQLSSPRFEQLFGTPHETDVEALAAAHHVPAATVEQVDELVEAIGRPGPSVTRVVTDRAENVRIHNELNAAVAAALG
jgi:2-succinyl-5-enolpyruvyl-6-hydroxy-3-cyclohexene-1-carboxylate synthase